MNIHIKNGYVITPRENKISVEKKDIYIEHGIVGFAKPFDNADKLIDAENKVIFPGLVNAHHHIYSCLSKGIPAEVPFNDFVGTLSKLWWKLDRALLKDDVMLSTVLTLQDCIKHGVTTVFDHHISTGFIENSLSTMAEIFQDFNISGSLCFEVSDRNGEDVFRDSLTENIRFAEKHRDSSVKGMIGLHASFTLSEESLRQLADQTDDFPIHMHIAEGDIDEYKCWQDHGKTIIKRLSDFGLLRKNSLLIHGSNLFLDEIRMLKDKELFIAQAVDSNMNNGLSVGNTHRFVKAGLNTTVGTDGMTSNIMKAYKNTFLLMKYISRDPDIGFPEMQALLLNSYKLKQAFDFPLGILHGEAADLAIFDYQPATPFNEDTFLAHFIYGITESRAQWVIKQDNILLDNFRLRTTEKYDNLIDNATQISRKMFERFEGM
jgi:cytosine/adenosine deaminase-related metal-dependent hydrolase